MTFTGKDAEIVIKQLQPLYTLFSKNVVEPAKQLKKMEGPKGEEHEDNVFIAQAAGMKEKEKPAAPAGQQKQPIA